MRTLGFVLLAAALVVFVMILGLVRGARRRRRAQRSYLAKETGGDDSPTGYVQGVWLLGGGDSPKSQGHTTRATTRAARPRTTAGARATTAAARRTDVRRRASAFEQGRRAGIARAARRRGSVV
jgi:hypothetical protein